MNGDIYLGDAHDILVDWFDLGIFVALLALAIAFGFSRRRHRALKST
jgi:hypothetical protein